MPRRKGSEWDRVRGAMLGIIEKGGSVEEQGMPEKACGRCRNYIQGGCGLGAVSGMCNILKEGSDITLQEPLFQIDGDSCYLVIANMDASKCKYYS